MIIPQELLRRFFPRKQFYIQRLIPFLTEEKIPYLNYSEFNVEGLLNLGGIADHTIATKGSKKLNR